LRKEVEKPNFFEGLVREMSFDLQLQPSCSGCGSTTDLYGSNCKHMTLCLTCGKTMAENRGKCFDCGAIVTRLIRVQFLSLFDFVDIFFNLL
jgi:predicted amidophosphoribosyltransferase